MDKHTPDLQVDEDGLSGVVFITPLSPAAREWMEANIEDAEWYFGALMIERRYLDNLLEDLKQAGLY